MKYVVPFDTVKLSLQTVEMFRLTKRERERVRRGKWKKVDGKFAKLQLIDILKVIDILYSRPSFEFA